MNDLRAAAQQALETVYETIIHWDEGGGKRSRRELARRIVALYAAPPQRKPLRAEPHVWVCPEAPDTHRYDKPGHCEDCGKTLIQMAEPVQEPVAELIEERDQLREQNTMLDAKLGELEAVAEPVAWQAVGGSIWAHKTREDDRPLYTAPPQRKPLTDEEIEQIADGIPIDDVIGPTTWHLKLARAVEQAHGIGKQE